MTGVCGHLPGVTCSNCRLASDDRWTTPPPPASDLDRIASALEKLVDVLTSDRYAANEERQREETHTAEVQALSAKTRKRWARTLDLLMQAEAEEREEPPRG